MQVLNILKKTFVDSQIYVSLMGTLLAVFFLYEQNAFRFPTVVLIFITYFCGYLYTKYQHSKYFFRILILNVIAGIVCAFFIIHNHHISRLYKWLVIVMMGLFYNSFFLEKFIRKIPLLKVFYVGLVWALMNSWLSFEHLKLPVFFITFLFVTALILPFDIRDMKTDTIVTFPKLIGIQNTKYLSYLFAFTACILAVYFLKTEYAVSFYITTAITFLIIFFSSPEKKDAYFSFGLETCSGIPFLFLILLKYF